MYDDNDHHGSAVPEREILVPVQVDGRQVLLSVRPLAAGTGPEDEHEISARAPALDQVIDGVAALARTVAGRFHDLDASKVTMEFGCEIGFESGSFIAILGKATTKSAFKVGLEWSKPDR